MATAVASSNNTTTTNRGWWPWLQIQGVPRPSMDIAASQKGESYHAQTSRFFEGSQNVTYQNWYRACYATNLQFATDRIWGTDQDVKSFLMDKGRPTSKVALRHPIIRPILTRLIGAMDNVSINAKVETITRFAVTRKEAALGKMLLYGQAAKAGPNMAQAMQQSYGVGPDDEKTISDHDNTYQDALLRGVDDMMQIIAEKSGFDAMKKPAAERMALSGLCAMHCQREGQDLIWTLQDPLEVYWDTSSIMPDMTDGSYNGLCPLMDVSSIAAIYQASRDKIKLLDEWARMQGITTNTSQSTWPQMRPRVFTTYWKDYNYSETGYVLKDGEPHLCFINVPDPDSRDGKPQYTDKDLILPPENRYTAVWTEQQWKAKKQITSTEEIRYCTKIPWEYMPGAYTDGQAFGKNIKPPDDMKGQDFGFDYGDMVLAYGKSELQEPKPGAPYKKGTPLKISTWSYLGGFVVSPLTAAIWPQRVANMVASDLVWRMNKAGNNAVVIDTDAMKGSTLKEQEIYANLKEGDPINIKGNLMGGVQNAIKVTEDGLSQHFYQMWGILGQLSTIAEEATGVFKENYGAPADPKTLVRVKEIQSQQAGIMQQPFYSGISRMFEQAHQFDAMAGKEFYCRFPWLLAEMCGMTDAAAVEMSKDMQIEEFRCAVRISADMETERQTVDNSLIPSFLQLGLLDAKSAAPLFGKSRPEDVYEASEEFTQTQAQAAQAQAEAAQQQQQQAGIQAQAQGVQAREDDLYKDHLNTSLKMAEMSQSAQAPYDKAHAEATYAPLADQAAPVAQ